MTGQEAPRMQAGELTRSHDAALLSKSLLSKGTATLFAGAPIIGALLVPSV